MAPYMLVRVPRRVNYSLWTMTLLGGPCVSKPLRSHPSGPANGGGGVATTARHAADHRTAPLCVRLSDRLPLSCPSLSLLHSRQTQPASPDGLIAPTLPPHHPPNPLEPPQTGTHALPDRTARLSDGNTARAHTRPDGQSTKRPTSTHRLAKVDTPTPPGPRPMTVMS